MHTKVLIRPENFYLRYQHWQEKACRVHLEMLRGSYANEVFGKGSDDLNYEHSSQYARIVWHPDSLQIEDLAFVLEHLSGTLLKNNYALQLKDERNEVFDSGHKVSVQRHYLKPDLPCEEVMQNGNLHLYGNIFLEHRFSRQFNALHITSNYYGNKRYLSFEKLMEVLLA